MAEGLIKAISEKKGILLCGAGVSKATSQHKYADWNGLIENGIYTCKDHSFGELGDDWVTRKLRDIKEGDVIDKISVASQITERMQRTGTDTFKIWVENTISKLLIENRMVVEALGALGLPILTTNYDTLIEQVLTREIVTWKYPGLCANVLKSKSNAILHLHGCWKDPQSLVFDFNSYGRIVADDFIQTLLRCIEFNYSMIFVGMGEGLNDPNFHGFLSWAKGSFLNSQTEHYLLVKAGEVPTGLPDSIKTIVYGKTHADLPLFLERLRKKEDNSSSWGKSVRSERGPHVTPLVAMEVFRPLMQPETQTEKLPVIIEVPTANKVDKILRDTTRQNLAEMQDLIVLCVLQRMDKELLAAYWKEHLTDKLIRLGQDSAFFTNGILNKEAWSSYRKYWRSHSDFTHGVVSAFEKIIDKQLSDIHFEDPDFYNWYTHYLNIRSWKIGSAALPELLKGMLIGWLRGEDFQPVIELTGELQASNAAEEEIKAFLMHKALMDTVSLKVNHKDLMILINLSVDGWQPFEKAYLYLLIAYNYAEEKEYFIALHYFDLAFPLLDDHLPYAALFEKAYLDTMTAVFTPPITSAQIDSCAQWIAKFKFNASGRHGGITKAFYMAGEYDVVIPLWEQQLKYVPGDVMTLALLIKTLSFHQGKHKEAIAVFNNAPERVKHLNPLCLQVAHAYTELKQFKQLERLFKRMLSCKHASKRTIHGLLGGLYIDELNNFKAAKKHIAAALKEKGSDYEQLNLSVWYLNLLVCDNQKEDAISLVPAIEKMIEKAGAKVNMGWLNSIAWDLYLLNYRLDLAESLSLRSIELEGDIINTLHTLSSILVRRKKWDIAEPYMKEWLGVSNDSFIKHNWDQYSLIFQDLIRQNKQDWAEKCLQERKSAVWLMVRWAMKKSSGSPQTIVLPPAQLSLAQSVYLQLTGEEVPDKFPV